MGMKGILEFTEKELMEIQLCMYYAEHLAHGTTGHSRIMLLAKLARYIGFTMDENSVIQPPPEWQVLSKLQ